MAKSRVTILAIHLDSFAAYLRAAGFQTKSLDVPGRFEVMEVESNRSVAAGEGDKMFIYKRLKSCMLTVDKRLKDHVECWSQYS